MSDDENEMWRAMHAERKERKRQRFEQNVARLNEAVRNDDKLTVVQIDEYTYRVQRDYIVADYWPSTNAVRVRGRDRTEYMNVQKLLRTMYGAS